MRIFIGISLSQQITRNILTWQENYQKEFKTPGVRFIQPQNLHITIIPPWHVDDTKKTVGLLDQQMLGKVFDILFEKILFMPPQKSKYTWAFGQTPEELTSLRLKILEVLGRPYEKRNYALHTTIARMQKDAAFENLTENIHWLMLVKNVSLFRSFLSPKGAEYEVVKEFALR